MNHRYTTGTIDERSSTDRWYRGPCMGAGPVSHAVSTVTVWVSWRRPRREPIEWERKRKWMGWRAASAQTQAGVQTQAAQRVRRARREHGGRG